MFTIRSSTLSSWNDCPRREAVKSFGELIKSAGFPFASTRTKQNIGAAIGSGVHEGAGWALSEKKKGNANTKYDDALQVSIERFRTEIHDGVLYDDLSPNKNTSEKQILWITKAYWHTLYPTIQPISVEEHLKATINDDFNMTGHPDVITDGVIRDLKCGKIDRIHMPQLGGYSLLARANSITIPHKVLIDWVPRSDIKKTQQKPQTFEYNARLSEEFAHAVIKNIIQQHRDFTSSGDPYSFPANPYSMLCTPIYCPAYGTQWCKVRS